MTSSIFDRLHVPCDKWIELHDSLIECLRRLPTTKWTPKIVPTGKAIDHEERKHIQKQIFADYKSVVPSTSEAVKSIVTKNEWPELNDKEIYFLHLMLSKAIRFVRSIVVGRGGPPMTIFPFPEADVSTVALWLLSEWWIEHGLHDAYEEATTDEMLFHKYFS